VSLFRLAKNSSFVYPLLTGVLAIAIFVADSFTHFERAVPVFYVAVVLLAVRFFDARGVMLVAAGCIGLVVLSHLLAPHDVFSSRALINLAIGIFAIAFATYLTLRNQSAHMAIIEQARLLDLTHDSILVRDKNNAITFWNHGAEELYGWRSEQVVGKNYQALLQTRFPTSREDIETELLRTGRWEGELVHVKSDGGRTIVASRWSLLKDERQRPIAVLETNNDITEQKRAEEKLQQAQVELAHVTRTTTLGELTASIAHEVNQPLAAIVTNGEVCLRLLPHNGAELKEVRGAIKDVIANSIRASEIIQRLRALCTKTAPEKRLLSINDIIRETISLVQHELRRHGVSLKLELGSALPQVFGDRVQLQQVLLNIVINGMEAIAFAKDGPRELQIRSYNGADHVTVAVRDSGIGICPDSENRLFQAFFTTKSGGMGMGLSICRSIIELHGGRVWASRNADRGATFQFSLPLHKGAEA
jgi:two-component system sensor kinase FixL